VRSIASGFILSVLEHACTDFFREVQEAYLIVFEIEDQALLLSRFRYVCMYKRNSTYLLKKKHFSSALDPGSG